jgi:hypothetical protein
MSLKISDPLSLLPYQSGLVAPPLVEGAAQGQGSLDSQQVTITLGEPVPIVFGRRIDNIGGVFVSPGATEGRYENNSTTNELTVRLQLVLSEGSIPPLQLRDVFQRACRVGTWKQSYDARTENWTPGNFITAVSGTEFWNCPYYCGTGGTYDNLTTLSYLNTHADGDMTWDKQVHCFVREGMQVTRILDNTFGPSNNVVDLALYLIRQSSRFPEDMLDLTAMADAAEFTNANGFFYNGIFKESTNLEDWLQQISRNFLLRISDKAGKKGFKPRLPVNNDGTIYTGVISWVFTFTEEHILPDGFEIEYIPLAERKPICAQMLWRQQPDNDIGIIRTTEVRLEGEAANGPFEQYDLSQFCASENHAVKIGAYEVAKRKFVTHILRLKVLPAAYNSTLELGDIVRVQLKRENVDGEITLHDYLYEVERINRENTGRVELDLIYFPVSPSGVSILANYVANAVGPGFTVPTGRADFQCDIAGRQDNTTPLASDPYTPPTPPDPADYEYDLPSNVGWSTAGSPGPNTDNPSDPIDNVSPPVVSGTSGPNGTALPGDTLTVTDTCEGQYNEWYLCPINNASVDSTCERVSEGVAAPYVIGLNADLSGKRVFVCGRCPDPSSPDGYGESNCANGIDFAGECEDGKTYYYPYQPGGVRVQFAGYSGNWSITDYGYGWLLVPTVSSSTALQYQQYAMKADGTKEYIGCLPKQLVVPDCQPTVKRAQLTFTRNNVPFDPYWINRACE